MASVDALDSFLEELDFERTRGLPADERASRLVAALESPQVLAALSGLPTEQRLNAVARIAPLLAGTPAGTAMARELFSSEAALTGPLAARLLGNASLPATLQLAVAFAAGFGATDGEALARLTELALGRPLTTREYITVQDVSAAAPEAHALQPFSSVVAQLGAASRDGGGFLEGVELIRAFVRARRLSRDVP